MKTRCPWCCARGQELVCDHCAAALIPAEQFGAARMLVHAGVDRLALPERVRALSRNQFVALSSQFDVHWSVVQRHLEQTRFLEKFLLLRHREALEDALLVRIPLPEDELRLYTDAPRLPEDNLAALDTIQNSSPLALNRTLA